MAATLLALGFPVAAVLAAVPDGIDSLPANWVAAAEQEIGAGRPQRALSLLYRGGLVLTAASTGLVFPESATEGECIRLAGRALDQTGNQDLRSYLEETTRLWLQIAYASIAPVTDVMLRVHRAALELTDGNADG